MGRRGRRERGPITRLDFSELGTNDVLLEDLLRYVGSPKTFIPVIWDTCVKVLRSEKRIVLTERDNGEVLDQIYTDFYQSFSETKFRRIIADSGISVRMSSYRENLAQFLYDVFEILYPQIASTVDRLIRKQDNGSLLNYRCNVIKEHYLYINDGFGEVKRLVGVDVEISTENMLSSELLIGDGYGF